MYKIAFIIQFNQPTAGGVFFTATTRIKYFIQKNKDFEVRVFNIRSRPFFLIRLFRYLKTGEKFYTQSSLFNDLFVSNVFYSISLIEYLKLRLSKGSNFDFKDKIVQLSKYFEDVDLIAAHFGNGPGELALYLSEFLNKKFTVTFHGSDIHTTPFISKEKFALYQNMLCKSSANIFLSEGLLKKSLSIYNSFEKSYALYNGIDYKIFRKIESNEIDNLRKRYQLQNKVVGFVGNLIEVKNVLTLIKIFHEVNKNYLDVSFMVIGDGNLKGQLKNGFIRIGLDVNFFGPINHKEMPFYYNLLDILVLPSKNEGLPRVILESMACGVQCVGSKVTGIEELLPPENTFALDKDFELNIAKRIVEILKSNSRSTFDKSKFDLKVIASRQGDIYRKVIDD